MRESATCSQCGLGYTYPADLDAKTGMHCKACGALIHVKTGLPFGEAPSPHSGRKQENARKTSSSLPPVRKKQPASSGGIPEAAIPRKGEQLPPPISENRSHIPITSWLAWGLALFALLLAFIFPSYGNDSTDPLYMLQRLPSIIFGCTAAVLFIQGLAAMRR